MTHYSDLAKDLSIESEHEHDKSREAMFHSRRVFNAWNLYYNYRAKDENGNYQLHDALFKFDSLLTRITDVTDLYNLNKESNEDDKRIRELTK